MAFCIDSFINIWIMIFIYQRNDIKKEAIFGSDFICERSMHASKCVYMIVAEANIKHIYIYNITYLILV